MSADVKEVERLLDERGIDYSVTDTGHEVRWVGRDGRKWSYYGRLYSGRDPRLTAYRIDPEDAVKIACGEDQR